jgi:beta-lactamase regulating signal transducer with metallopeptidase domain
MANDIVRSLFALTVVSSVAIIAALILRLGLRPLFGVTAGYSAWLLVPVGLAAVFLPHFHYADSAVSIALDSDSASALRYELDESLGRLLSVGQSSIRWPPWVLGAWCVGAALFLAYLVGAQRAFVNSLGALSGSQRVLRAERSAGCPALLGVIRPKIVLPLDFKSRYTRFERLLIFSHERIHLRQGDAAWNALVALLRCLFWFNPLVHIASTYFRVDQELACDAAVLRDHPGSRRAYARAMLKTQLADAALPIGCRWQSIDHFKERLQMLKRTTPGRARRLGGHAFVMIASSIVGYGAWAAEPIANQAGLDEGRVRFTGLLSAIAIDDRRHLVGVSSRADGEIDHLFLYTSLEPSRFRMNIKDVRSIIDYEPGVGLHFTLQGRTFFFNAGAAGLSGVGGEDRSTATFEPLGQSFALSHYLPRRALSESEFWKLRTTGDCRGTEPPCIQVAGQVLPFPG